MQKPVAVRTLLIYGLLAGLLAGLVAFGAASLLGEPSVNAGIAYEAAHEPTPAVVSGDHAQAPVVSRETQSTFGLATATAVYGTALGGLLALAFAFLYGRVIGASPLSTALWIGAGGFLTVFLIPFLKYPASPPGSSDPTTIGSRTILFVGMMVIALLAAVVGAKTRAWIAGRRSDLAGTGGAAAFVIIVALAALWLPPIHEVPNDFPAGALWDFRRSSVMIQAVMWSTLAVAFALAAQRAMTKATGLSRTAEPVG